MGVKHLYHYVITIIQPRLALSCFFFVAYYFLFLYYSYTLIPPTPPEQVKQGKCLGIDPLCALDFYVSEEFQRRGIGRMLVNSMLEVCTINAFYFFIFCIIEFSLPFITIKSNIFNVFFLL
jgi:GNAT superfamily N-acetyltransferase